MKKLSIILLAILLTVSLFVSCDNTTKAVTDEHVAVTFSTGADSRSLSYAIENVSELKWYYSAQKNSNDTSPFAFGATTETEITLGDTVEFSQGLWDFTLWAKRVNTRADGTKFVGDKVYQGDSKGVLIKKDNSPRTIVIDVFPKVEGSTGSIKLNGVTITLRDTESTQEPVFANKAVIKGKGISINGEGIPIDETSHIGEKTGLTPGDYDVTVKYTGTVVEEGQSQELVYASETITVTVWSGRTTTVSGDISELTGSAIINGDIKVPSISTIQKTVVESEPTVFSANVAPSNNAQSTTLDKTTVTFPSGTLGNGTTATLEVNVSPIDADFTVAATGSPTTVGAISLKLNDAASSSFGSNEVTIETYIAKNLSNVKVYYDGSEISGSTYDSSTGKLVFKTTHFSEFYVGADEIEAYNATTKKAYEKLYSSDQNTLNAISEVINGDTVVLLKDVKLTNPTSDNCIQIKETMTLDGNGYSIYCEDTTLPANARLVNITGIQNKDITIKNITIKSANSGAWMRGLNLYNVDTINLNIVDSVIQIPHYYALNIATDCTNTTISINSTTIRGWATVYNHSSGVNLTANNSKFDSVNPTLGGGDTNSFGNVIVAEYYNWDGSGDSTNNNFVFNNCEFTADKLHPEADVKQVVCDVRSPNNNKVSFNGCTLKDLSTPQYLKVAIDTLSENDLDVRREMLRKSHIYIDGVEVSEGNPILNSYIDWDYDDEEEDGILVLCDKDYLFDPIPYLGGDINEDGSCTVVIENYPDNTYTFNSTYDSDTNIWTLSCEISTLTWKDKLLAEYAALTDEESEITLSGEYVLDSEIVLDWPSENVKSIKINGGDGLSITGPGTLHFKYPESNPSGDGLVLTLGSGNIWSYFSNIIIG